MDASQRGQIREGGCAFLCRTAQYQASEQGAVDGSNYLWGCAAYDFCRLLSFVSTQDACWVHTWDQGSACRLRVNTDDDTFVRIYQRLLESRGKLLQTFAASPANVVIEVKEVLSGEHILKEMANWVERAKKLNLIHVTLAKNLNCETFEQGNATQITA